MSVKVAIFRRSEIGKERTFVDLAVVIETEGNGHSTKLRPSDSQGPQEPMWTTVKGRAGLKSPDRHVEGAAKILVTRRRLLLLIDSGMNAKGLETKSGSDQMAIVSVERTDLGPPQLFHKRTGKIKRVEYAGASEPFTVLFPFVPNFNELLELMAPEYAQQMGDAVAEEVRAEKRAKVAAEQEAARQADAEKQRKAAERFSPGDAQSGPSLGGLAAGILDHRRTWRYKLAATPDQCIAGFVAAFSGHGGLVLKAKWSTARAPNGAVAIYKGRKGLAAAGPLLSEQARREEQIALGSEVRFEIEEQGDGYTICAMWLAEHGEQAGFLITDARFFRPYMRAVATQLRQVDPSLQVVKD